MSTTQTELMQVTSQNIVSRERDAMDAGNLQYLTFMLGGELYGVDILRVQEIRGWAPVTSIPNTPEYLRGVLNLRGDIVPIVDLRIRFNLEEAEYNALTVIIVLSVQTEAGNRVIGVVVDAVSDVLNVAGNEIKETPDFGGTVNIEFISGLATVDEHMIMLLDIDKMLTTDEMIGLEKLAESM